MNSPNPYQRDDQTWWWFDETWMDYGPFMTPEAATIELEYYCEHMLGVKQMSKVLSLTAKQKDFLVTRLSMEGPWVEGDGLEERNAILAKLTKDHVTKTEEPNPKDVAILGGEPSL